MAQQQYAKRHAHARRGDVYYEEEEIISDEYYDENTEEYTIGEVMSVIPEESNRSISTTSVSLSKSIRFDLSASDLPVLLKPPTAESPNQVSDFSPSKQQQAFDNDNDNDNDIRPEETISQPISPSSPTPATLPESEESPQTPPTAGPGMQFITRDMLKHLGITFDTMNLSAEQRKVLEASKMLEGSKGVSEGSSVATSAAATFTGMELGAPNLHDISPLTFHYQHTGTILAVDKYDAPSLSPLTKPESYRYFVPPAGKKEKKLPKICKMKEAKPFNPSHKKSSKSHHKEKELNPSHKKSKSHHKEKELVSFSNPHPKSRKKEELKSHKEKESKPRKEKDSEQPRKEKESKSPKAKESRSKTIKTHDNNVGKETILKAKRDSPKSKTTTRRGSGDYKESVAKAHNHTTNSTNRKTINHTKTRSKNELALKDLREKIKVHAGDDEESVETALVTKRTATSRKTKSSESHKKRPSVETHKTKTKKAALFDSDGSFDYAFSSDEEDNTPAKKSPTFESPTFDGRRSRTPTSGSRARSTTPSKRKLSVLAALDNALSKSGPTILKKGPSTSKRSKSPGSSLRASSGNVENDEAGKQTRRSDPKSHKKASRGEMSEPDLTTDGKSVKSGSSKKSRDSKTKKSEKRRKEETPKKTKTEKSANSNKKTHLKKQKKQA